MLDLKPYFDAVNAAEAEVQRIANELDTLFRQETPESKVKAIALRPALDEAQAKHAEAVSLYESMQKANRPNDVARNFVPVSTPSPDDADGSQPTVIKRQAYNQLSLVDRAKFIRSGGALED
jgi:ElaB/YqjD/DUF883 family membrane-anchored ribosome-binding protein